MTGLLLSACYQVDIKDHEFCADFGPDGAHCAHFLTKETRDLTKAEWDLEREDNMVCEKMDVFADWKVVIEKLCSVSKRCTYQEKELLRNFSERLAVIDDQQKALRATR